MTDYMLALENTCLPVQVFGRLGLAQREVLLMRLVWKLLQMMRGRLNRLANRLLGDEK